MLKGIKVVKSGTHRLGHAKINMVCPALTWPPCARLPLALCYDITICITMQILIT